MRRKTRVRTHAELQTHLHRLGCRCGGHERDRNLHSESCPAGILAYELMQDADETTGCYRLEDR